MKALKIQVNFLTGERPRGISVRDPNLRGHPAWQDIEAGYEIRLILDGDSSRYDGIDGVEILDGESIIDAEVEAMQARRPAEFTVVAPELFLLSGLTRKPSLAELDPDDHQQCLCELKRRGILGIAERRMPLIRCRDLAPPGARGDAGK